MKAITKRNLIDFIESPKNQGGLKFPKGFTFEMFTYLTDAQQKAIVSQLGNHIKVKARMGYGLDMASITKADLSKVKNFKFSKTYLTAMHKKVETSNEMKQTKVDNLTPLKKEKKEAKLKRASKVIKSIEQYDAVLNNPLFNREMLEIILKRMEKKTAFEVSYGKGLKNYIGKIVTHPLITTEDLLRIRDMKAPNSGWGNAKHKLYASSSINTLLADRTDVPKEVAISLVKIMQYDIKVKIFKRDDLDTKDEDLIIKYTIKHHSHMPKQVNEILTAAGKLSLLDDTDFRKKVIIVLKKKYQSNNMWRNTPSGIKFFEVVDEYGWMDTLTDDDVMAMVDVMANAIEVGKLQKDKVKKIISKMADGVKLMAAMYDKTQDESFLPGSVKDIFLF